MNVTIILWILELYCSLLKKYIFIYIIFVIRGALLLVCMSATDERLDLPIVTLSLQVSQQDREDTIPSRWFLKKLRFWYTPAGAGSSPPRHRWAACCIRACSRSAIYCLLWPRVWPLVVPWPSVSVGNRTRDNTQRCPTP